MASNAENVSIWWRHHVNLRLMNFSYLMQDFTRVFLSTFCEWIFWALPFKLGSALQWRHNGRDSVSNHQPHDCLLNRLFRRRSKKISKLRVTGLCAGNSPATGEFPAQMASNAENASIWWRHHGLLAQNAIDDKSILVQVKAWCRQPMFTQTDVATWRH